MEPKSTKKIMEELFADKLSDLGFNKSKQRTWYKIVNEKNLIVIYGDRTYYDEYVDDIYFEYHLCLFPAHTYQDLDFHILDNVTSFNTSSIYYCLEKKNHTRRQSIVSEILSDDRCRKENHDDRTCIVRWYRKKAWGRYSQAVYQS